MRATALTVLATLAAAGAACADLKPFPDGELRPESRPEDRTALPSEPARKMKADAALPIRAITLYRSGVGYFERRGLIEGDADVQLTFDEDQVNDILKSMVLFDIDGGDIETISYGSREPLERRLASFGIDISDDPDLAKLLRRIRGADVALELPAGAVQGRVLGVEERPVAHEGGATVSTPFVNIISPAGIRSIDISEIASMQILDEDLAGELAKALGALSEQRADRVKTVDISLRGVGERRVVTRYVHEMPVWKPSYRLVLPDDASGNGKPTIQGWAIVENTTDEDWTDVTLSLVAGRPVSFQMDLYEPLHADRPFVPVPTVPGVAPRVYRSGAGEAMRQALREEAEDKFAAGRDRARRGAAPAPTETAAAAKSFASFGNYAEGAPAARAAAVEEGEVFQYRLDTPVTIERQRSAMIPILSEEISGRRVSIFSSADGSEHPMRGVELVNTTDLQLMPGPISVFDSSAYAGDAQIGHVPAGDKRLLAYAVDLHVQAITESSGDSRVESIRIVQGMLEQISKRTQSVRYAFANKDEERDRTIIIEHPKMGGWDLTAPNAPSEETESLYRFELDVAGGKSRALTVSQERVESSRTALVSAHMPTLVAHARNGRVSQDVLDAVREAARLQSLIAGAERELTRLDQERNEIAQDQSRIRQNMNSIDRRSELYTRYLRKFDEQETRLEALASERDAAQKKLDERRVALENYLKELNVS
jgi:hypothetical protein